MPAVTPPMKEFPSPIPTVTAVPSGTYQGQASRLMPTNIPGPPSHDASGPANTTTAISSDAAISASTTSPSRTRANRASTKAPSSGP